MKLNWDKATKTASVTITVWDILIVAGLLLLIKTI